MQLCFGESPREVLEAEVVQALVGERALLAGGGLRGGGGGGHLFSQLAPGAMRCLLGLLLIRRRRNDGIRNILTHIVNAKIWPLPSPSFDLTQQIFNSPWDWKNKHRLSNPRHWRNKTISKNNSSNEPTSQLEFRHRDIFFVTKVTYATFCFRIRTDCEQNHCIHLYLYVCVWKVSGLLILKSYWRSNLYTAIDTITYIWYVIVSIAVYSDFNRSILLTLQTHLQLRITLLLGFER